MFLFYFLFKSFLFIFKLKCLMFNYIFIGLRHSGASSVTDPFFSKLFNKYNNNIHLILEVEHSYQICNVGQVKSLLAKLIILFE